MGYYPCPVNMSLEEKKGRNICIDDKIENYYQLFFVGIYKKGFFVICYNTDRKHIVRTYKKDVPYEYNTRNDYD